MSLRELICRVAVAVTVAAACITGMVSNPPGPGPDGASHIEIRKVATAHCVDYSAKCTFTLTPAEQKTIIAAGGGGSAVYLAASCGPTALACLAAAAAVVAALSTYLSENVRENCDLVVYTIPNPIGTGVIVKGFSHRCP